jgi:hypothetical protein
MTLDCLREQCVTRCALTPLVVMVLKIRMLQAARAQMHAHTGVTTTQGFAA